MVIIYEYLDYRKLIKDLYEERKKQNPIFSYRYIGQRVGFKSAGFLTNIIKGKRNISHGMIFKFAELFKFNKKETEYFELLVLYNQSTQHTRRKYYFERLIAMRRTKVHELTEDQYLYFEKWYNVAIRELLNFYPFRGDFQDLARMLNPPITAMEAKKSVELLKKLKLIKKEEDNSYRVTNKTITSVPSIPLVGVHTFQIAMMELAREAIDRIPMDQRSISTLTLSISKETYRIIEEKLALFRRELLDLISNDSNIDRVYQFNFQIFPLSVEKESHTL